MVGAAISGRRVAIVHERFTEYAGSERVVEQLHLLWPDATIHAPIVDRAALGPVLAAADVRSGPLQRAYRGGGGYAHLLPLLPLAMARLDLAAYDLVVTSHHAFANRVRGRGTPVISYTHTPARWIWEPSMRTYERGGHIGRMALSVFAATQRRPDHAAADRLTGVVANSRHVADRVARWWQRDATVIHPPVDVHTFTPDPATEREDFFLLAGRLVPYKRPEVAAAAAARAGVRLVVAGDGRARQAVEAAAPAGTEFLGTVDTPTLRDLFRRCRALVFPGEEDFGIVPVEAQACGTPVLAARVGGVCDSVMDGRTGALYEPGHGPTAEVESLARAMIDFDPDTYDPVAIRRHAEGFAPERFRREFYAAVERMLDPSVGAA